MDKDQIQTPAGSKSPRVAQPEGPPVVLEGDRLRLAFSSADYRIISFVGKDSFGEICPPQQRGSTPLWRIKMMANRGLPAKPLDPKDYPKGSKQWLASIEGLGEKAIIEAAASGERSHRIERTNDGVTLRLLWKGIDVGTEKGAFDVTATVKIPKGANLAYWTLDMKNRSRKFGIWEYTYPIIDIRPPDADLEKNYFVNGYRMGEVVPDPFHVRPDDKGRTLYNDRRRLYVGHNTKCGQFTALYGANGRGFFYSSRDGQGWQKVLDVHFYPKMPCARIEMVHAPLNLAFPGEDFTMPYPVVAGFFRGDWYDVCQLHREWAVKQVWCRKGPVARRKDIPQWLKDACVMLRQDTKADASKSGGLPVLESRREQTLANNTKNFLRCLEVFGKSTPSIWYTWWVKDKSRSLAPVEFLQNTGNGNDGQLVAPIPGVPDANRKIVAAGGYPLAYINAVIYDMGDAQEWPIAQQAAQRDLLGKHYGSGGDPQACSMCRYARWWRDRYAELCRRAIQDFGFKGVYWDSYGKDGYRCYNTSHGHSYGGGTKWIQGERQFGEYVRKVMKQADPEAVTSAEASSEEFIDLVDTRLCATILREHVAPLFSCIYHDYQLFYGRTVRGSTEEPAFSMIAGYAFNMGSQLGRYFIHGKSIDVDAPQNKKKAVFLKALVEAKRSAKEFLNLGRMLRPPKIVSDMPTLTGQIWYQKQIITLPAVLCSAWKAPNGDVALVFVNCSYDAVEYTYQVDTVEYGFPRGTKIPRQLRKSVGSQPLAPITSATYKEIDKLPGHGIRIIVLRGGE